MRTIFIIIVIAAVVLFTRSQTVKKTQVAAPVAVTQNKEDIRGCYVATLQKDVYSLTIQSQENETVLGTLEYKNYQKDSSRGTFAGVYKDGILRGDYAFNSEGMASVREVQFKRIPNGFVQGFGEATENQNRSSFVPGAAITYDNNLTFKKVECSVQQ